MSTTPFPIVIVAASAGGAGLILILILFVCICICCCRCCSRSLDKLESGGGGGGRLERGGSFRLSRRKLVDPIDNFRSNHRTEGGWSLVGGWSYPIMLAGHSLFTVNATR